MRRPAAVIGVFLVCCTAACTLRRQVAPPSPYCRGGYPLVGVYHPSRLRVKSRCRVAVGTVSKVVFEAYDGDVHIDLRLDPGYESLLSYGNDRVGGNLVVELIPFDRSRVAVPDDGARIEVVGPWVEDTSTAGTRSTRPGGSAPGQIEPASAAELRAVQLLLQTNACDSR